MRFGREPDGNHDRGGDHDIDHAPRPLLHQTLQARRVAVADQGRRLDRGDARGLEGGRGRQAQQAPIASQLAAHEDRRAEAVPVLVLERLHHPQRHLQAAGDVFLGHARGLAGLAQPGAATAAAIRRDSVGFDLVRVGHRCVVSPGAPGTASGNSSLNRRT